MPEIRVDNPVRALALAVIARAVADAVDDDPIPGDERAPGEARRNAWWFLHDAVQDGPSMSWFWLAELDPGRVLTAARKKEEARRAAGKGVKFEQLSFLEYIRNLEVV